MYCEGKNSNQLITINLCNAPANNEIRQWPNLKGPVSQFPSIHLQLAHIHFKTEIHAYLDKIFSNCF